MRRFSVGRGAVDLGPLASFAQARLIHAAATGLDLENKLVQLEGRPPLRYDVLSIDIGITPAGGGVPGADEYSTPVKPINGFSARWDSLVQRVLQSQSPMHVVVVNASCGRLLVIVAHSGR